ncbi:benzoate/H(+) symporter BenE family transporter [Janibacter terrae]|jgi:benzoate membrane transport protein|uniref:benzoate/H(+) symporter BenE family transporter n=1 Tax=Janibacter terrae TaxID=103817 RepID=UPI0009EDE503|nr:benzoate/H(+) symporter BenE family transporter [Janibacter terrae]HBO53882.1 benzoate transporter [Janibacter terrae]
MREPTLQPVGAGVVTALVGFTSAFVIVLAGLEAVGASRAQAASGLMALTVLMALGSIVLSLSTRLPVTIAWSTPGAALLASTGAVAGGWSAAVGAFVVTGALVVLTGLVPALGALIARIPASVAQAMLAGIVLQLCLGAVTGMAANPWAVGPVVLVWLLTLRLLPRWASPLAFVAAAVVIGVHLARSGTPLEASALVPRLELTTPTFTIGGLVGIALPLYLVTMASQNVPGLAVMRGYGYEVPWQRAMLVTGAGTLLGAPAGGHGINLAAISAALAAGPEAGEDRSRRWIASVTSGTLLLPIGIASAALATLVALAPEGVVPAVAGLALVGTLAGSLRAALADPADHVPAVTTFVVAASGVAVAGISAAFWAIVVGVGMRLLLVRVRVQA